MSNCTVGLPRWYLLTVLLAMGSPTAVAQIVRVETVSETLAQARLIDVQLGDKPELRLQGRSIPLRDVLAIEYGRPLLPTRPFEVLLADGSRLIGQITGSSKEDYLTVSCEFGSLEVNIEWMQRVRQLAPQTAVNALPKPIGKSDSDHLFTREGASLEGILLSMDADGVAFEDGELGELRFAWSQVESVHIASLDRSDSAEGGVQVRVEGRSGSLLKGHLLSLAGNGLEVESPHFGKRKVEVSQLAAVRFDLGRVAYLSSRDPIRVEEANPWISPEIFSSFYSWQRDRSVDRKGTPLQIGERVFRRGLGVHSTSRLTFEVIAGDQVFQSWVGIDATGRPQENNPDFGSVIFKVLVDGEVRYDSGDLNWQKPAVRIPDISLVGAKTLELLVEMGKGLHVLDRADWGDARILRD